MIAAAVLSHERLAILASNGQEAPMNSYVVVRMNRALSDLKSGMEARYRGGHAESAPSRALADTEIQIDHNVLSIAEAADARRDQSVLAVAPTMPTRLIQPLVGSGSDEKEDAWGVAAVAADRSTVTGAPVKVAVLDTGIDAAHPAFRGVNLVQRDFSGSGDGDRQGHGTHCAGIIFGRNVSDVRIGVARGVREAFIGKVLDDDGSGDTAMLLKGMNWALENGAHVISMSLGFDFPGLVKRLTDEEDWPVELATSTALDAYRENLRAFDAVMQIISAYQAFNACGLVVAASGNESRIDENPRFRLSASLPSAAQGVLAIGALARGNSGHLVAPFSNGAVKLVAPGVDILSAQTGGGLVSLSGTSMACPHAAGVAALWWDQLGVHSRDAGELVRVQLLNTARIKPIDSGANYDERGLGIVTAP